jgi:signal transduction histidine kinase
MSIPSTDLGTLRKRMTRGVGATERAGNSALCNDCRSLAHLSHDLHNNLNCIGLHLKLLRQRLAAQPDFAEECLMLERAQLSIAQTVDGTRRLIVHESLRSGARQLCLEALDLPQLVASVVSQYRAAAEAKRLKLAIDLPSDTRVRSDGHLIVLVLQNLLGNSVKYSSDGTVSVRSALAAASRRGHRCIISVTDQGPGIEPVHLQHIFRAFQRASSHGQDGFGLGLSIALRAAKRLGAELSVESELGVGSTFSLALPTDQVDRKGASHGTASQSGTGKSVRSLRHRPQRLEHAGAIPRV